MDDEEDGPGGAGPTPEFYEGVLAVLVHSIQGVADTAGFMDKTDPYVQLRVWLACVLACGCV